MEKDTVIIVVILALALLVWVPAIVWSVFKVLKKGRKS